MLTSTSVEDAILILAYRLTDKGDMDTPLIKRLELGVKLYHKEKKPAIIVSGWRANKRLDLAQFSEADLMREYIHKWHGEDIPVFTEPDSTGIQENLLFTRKRFPRLKKLTVVTAYHALKRTEFHAQMVFAGNAVVKCVGCIDGASEPEREAKMLGDVKCMLSKLKPPYQAGQWKRLLLEPEDGRLRSKWNGMRDEHHATCPFYMHLHPGS